MSHPEDTPRQKFADWIAGVAEVWSSQEEGRTMSDFIEASGLGRNTIYRWMNRSDTKEPSIEAVKKFCDRLGLDFAVPAALLGWLNIDVSTLEGQIRRARIMLKNPNTPESDKESYRAILRSAELMFEAAFKGDEGQRKRA
jgi:transcriptional regulator with XRE-family HTH domain